MSSVNVNDPRIKKVNFRKAQAADIAMLIGSNAAQLGINTSADETYFARWEEKHQARLASTVVKLSLEELKEIKCSDWGARVDPFVVVTLGSIQKKTQIYKRTQDTKLSDTFEFPLPTDFETRSWELCIEVVDAQTNLFCGGIYLDLNDIFSDDGADQSRAPLVLSYPSINVALDSPKYGEDVCGSITFSLSSTTAFPKVHMIRERRAGILDLSLTPEAAASLLTDKEKAYMTAVDTAVKSMEDLLPELLESAGGPYLLQALFGDSFYGSAASGLLSSTPKLKGLSIFKGIASGLQQVTTTGALRKGGPGIPPGPVNDLPPEILVRIFGHLPPWNALTVRRVSSLWDKLASPELPDLWAMFHSYQQMGMRKDSSVDAIQKFCNAAFPFVRECARIVQFSTSLSFILIGTPIPSKDNYHKLPCVLGPIESLLNVVRILAYLDLWKAAVMTTMSSQINSSIYADSINAFKNHWQHHLTKQEYKESAEIVLFEDPHFWKTVLEFFTNDNSFTSPLTYMITPETASQIMSFADIVRSQLEKRRFGTEADAKYLCTILILFQILGKIVLGPPNLKKTKNPLTVLKDFENLIPAEYTRLLIHHGLMKDRSYTKF